MSFREDCASHPKYSFQRSSFKNFKENERGREREREGERAQEGYREIWEIKRERMCVCVHGIGKKGPTHVPKTRKHKTFK